jgi:hypothetical protein
MFLKSVASAPFPRKVWESLSTILIRDGWPDTVVTNDSFPEQLFRSNRDGAFTEVAAEFGMAFDEDGKTFAGMGIDFADYNNDG